MIQTQHPILVTGAAGFIGFHLSRRLLQEGFRVIGLDNLNDYYDVSLKESRIRLLSDFDTFEFVQLDLVDDQALKAQFEKHKFEYVINLAAQAGVRNSLENPYSYMESNLIGFFNILENCRHGEVKHLVFASSSSVYGANTDMPFNVERGANHPMTLYAASKKANEMMAHSYASSFKVPATGLRFFNAYGPWGRPDSALFIFVKSILEGKEMNVYNEGEMLRDFTYIDDIIEGVFRITGKIAQPDSEWDSNRPNPSTSYAPFRIFNIGNNTPVNLMDFVRAIETELGKEAVINYAPMQVGDIPLSHAESPQLIDAVDYHPSTSVEEGIHRFVNWYKTYYSI